MTDLIVKSETACDFCGTTFMGEFIEHKSKADDWPGESKIEEEDHEEPTYPHLHEQPTAVCHLCEKCRTEMKSKKEKKP